MPGIRVRPTAAALAQAGVADGRDRPWIIRDLARPYTGPPWQECAWCGHHEAKTYHLRFDGDGATIVSETVWQKLQGLFDCGGLEKVNDVEAPPGQSFVLPTAVVTLASADL